MGVVTEREYEIHYYESNYRLECKMSSIINYFCDIGTKQSEELGVGIDYLTEKRLDIKIKNSGDDENKRTFIITPHGKKYEDLCEAVL